MSNQVERNKPDNTQQDSLSTKGRWPYLSNCSRFAALHPLSGRSSAPSKFLWDRQPDHSAYDLRNDPGSAYHPRCTGKKN